MPPPVLDVAPIRCNPIDPRVRDDLGRRVLPRKGPLDKTAVRAWIDEHTIEQERKIAAGSLLMQEYERCRGASPST